MRWSNLSVENEERARLPGYREDAVVRHFSAPADAVTVTVVEAEPSCKAKGGILFSERAPR